MADDLTLRNLIRSKQFVEALRETKTSKLSILSQNQTRIKVINLRYKMMYYKYMTFKEYS